MHFQCILHQHGFSGGFWDPVIWKQKLADELTQFLFEFTAKIMNNTKQKLAPLEERECEKKYTTENCFFRAVMIHEWWRSH